MAILAYQVTGFAYQGAGQFAYQGSVDTPAVLTEEQASNWQATYWKRKSKADRENEEMLERIRLGILPPEVREETLAAVVDADNASRELAAGRLEDGEALLRAMEARSVYENAYKTIYKEAYIAEVVAELWKEDMKRIMRRRKKIALLLH